MKVVSLRALARQAPILDETVLVSHAGTLIGRFVPLGHEDPGSALTVGREVRRSKGANAPPDTEHPPSGHGFGRPRPAPKPGAGR